MSSNPQTCKQCGAVMAGDAPEGLCARCLLSAAIKEPSEAGKGAMPSAPAPEEIAKFFPQLEVIELLGRGGMGMVYKARQLQLDRLVALKILPSDTGSDPQFAQRFAREARALARLSHPNIVAVHDFGQTEGLFYFIMEFVDGANLRELMRSGQISPREALAIVPRICEALQFAHDEGIMHRDIKPENILIDKKGRVKIADFGLAKLLGRDGLDLTLTQAGISVGTPRYMAPEQVEHPDAVDHRADIYSLGVVFYEMLTGELPIGRFAAPSEKVQIDVRLDEIVLRSLEKDVARRYQQVSEVKSDVEDISGIMETLPPALRRMMGFEYRSRRTLFGWPLVHMVSGVDPRTGKARIARGIIAIGDQSAYGIFAFGGVAIGVFAFGGFGLGLFSFSAFSVAFLSIGGIAFGLVAAYGGVAVAPFALGGLAIGYIAAGGAAFGAHAAGGNARDPIAFALMKTWSWRAMAAFFVFLPLTVLVPIFRQVWAARVTNSAPKPRSSVFAAGASPYNSAPQKPGSKKIGFKRVGLWLVFLVGAVIFLSFDLRVDAGGARRSIEIGAFDPWFVFKSNSRWDVSFLNWSTFCGICAAVAARALWRREPAGASAAPGRRWPKWVLITAVLLVAIFVATPARHVSHLRHRPIFYTFSGVTDFQKGREGPVLSADFIKKSRFTPKQAAELNKTISAAYREFVSLERRHTDVSTDERGHVHVRIAPFPDESQALVKRFGAVLRGVSGTKMAPDPQPGQLKNIGLFRHAGEYTVDAELWKENGLYHFREELQNALAQGQKMSRGNVGRTADETFPDEYQVYWTE